MSKPQQFLQLLRLVIMVAAAAAAAAKAAASTVSQNCQAKCGNVSIPYPFGIGPGCHLEGFDVLCNTTFSPPRLFIGDTGAELIDISVPSAEARVYKHIDWVCYNQTAVVDFDLMPINLTTRPVYRISNTLNKFTGVGCSTVAYEYGDPDDNDDQYTSGCVTICGSLATVANDTCSGRGCCQIPLTRGLRSVGTTFDIGLFNNTRVFSFNPCSYAFVAEEGWYNFSPSDLVAGHLNSTYPRGVPAVLDWAVGNQKCQAARLDRTTYACVDNKSECFDSINGPGYICNCSEGYEGNPFLPNGCQDIDECKDPTEYPCYGVCTNTIGNYSCKCPRGKEGDPYTKDGCRSTGSFPVALKVLIAAMSSVFFLTVMSFGMYLGLQKRKLIRLKQTFFEQNGGLILQQQINSSRAATFKLFTQEELERATNKFDAELIIGRGGHGTVYKGTLEDQRVVAIKKSKVMDKVQTKEFAREMLILSQINHKNVIKILGCCLEVEVPMLVYEFIPNGTVFEYLQDKTISIPLDARLRIAEESASALAYLHSAASPPIIHGDVKSSNILLDEQFSAKVSDFGASKLAPKDEAQLATVVQGTCGYLDPEYLLTCQLTEKSDVYSFGVVILELLTRSKPFAFGVADGEEKNLASIFLAAVKQDKIADLLDSELREGGDLVVIKGVAGIAVQCLNFVGDERPTMKEVAENLEKFRKHKQSNRELHLPYNYQYSNPRPSPRNTNTESFDAHDASGSNTLEIMSLLDVGTGR